MGRLPEAAAQRSRTCPICNHAERAEIERCVLSMSNTNPTMTLDAIADAFDVSPKDLRIHALMHTPLALDFSDASERSLVNDFKEKAGQPTDEVDEVDSGATTHAMHDRLTDKLNLRESDMLMASANEMLTTMTALGKRIKRYAGSEEDQTLVNFCSNAMVNLYIGTSTELRKTVDAIREMNIAINGAHDSASEGLKQLALALHGSEQRIQDSGADTEYQFQEPMTGKEEE